jgi:GT2 family glycosyltransferase
MLESKKNILRDKFRPLASVIIVTYNSEPFLDKCITSLSNDLNDNFVEVIIVDNCSENQGYINNKKLIKGISVYKLNSNMGFSYANNFGYQKISEFSKYVLFLNPDAFVNENLLNNLYSFMEKKDNEKIAICSPLLLSYSINKDKQLETIDSAGISKSWYGKFFDKNQGEKFLYNENQSINKKNLICGAFMFCRKSSLEKNLRNSKVWDEKFFMYKEDIDLSLHLKSNGMDLAILNNYFAYHCRGWIKKRFDVSSFSIKHSLYGDWLILSKNYYPIYNQILHFLYLCIKSIFIYFELLFKAKVIKN